MSDRATKGRQPGVEEPFVGSGSNSSYRREVAKRIAAVPNHPLTFLLERNNDTSLRRLLYRVTRPLYRVTGGRVNLGRPRQPPRLRSSMFKGLTHDVLIGRSDLVDAAHVVSKKAGRGNRLILMDATTNRTFLRRTEQFRGAHVEVNSVVAIGGIAVYPETVEVWLRERKVAPHQISGRYFIDHNTGRPIMQHDTGRNQSRAAEAQSVSRPRATPGPRRDTSGRLAAALRSVGPSLARVGAWIVSENTRIKMVIATVFRQPVLNPIEIDDKQDDYYRAMRETENRGQVVRSAPQHDVSGHGYEPPDRGHRLADHLHRQVAGQIAADARLRALRKDGDHLVRERAARTRRFGGNQGHGDYDRAIAEIDREISELRARDGKRPAATERTWRRQRDRDPGRGRD